MRNTFLFVGSLLASVLFIREATAQATPQFQATIYVEDAIGNRNSVAVGFDTLATTGIDPQFGEVEITAPFDSVLEMRVGTFLGFERDMISTVIIEPSQAIFHPTSTTYGCFSSVPIFIYIWAKHQPIRVSWDSTVFLDNILCVCVEVY